MTQPPFDAQKAHHWFATEFNNRAWGLVESATRSNDEIDEMIHLAHAACIHWLQVGTLVNHLRAQCLLATAYAAAGIGDAAVRHAEKCLALCGVADNDATPFDRACAHGCAANAYAVLGRIDQAREEHRRAGEAIAEIDAADERTIVEQLYPGASEP